MTWTPAQMHSWDRWFRRIRREFAPLLLPFAGKPIYYVEIGCWAGASAEWVGQNILTHPQSRGLGIDPYPSEPLHPSAEIHLIKNCASARLEFMSDRWTWQYRPSQEVLAELITETIDRPWIDVLYIDGNHEAHNVLIDFALCWPMLKTGALVIFDDYWVKYRKRGAVKAAVHSAQTVWAGLIEPAAPFQRQAAFRVVKKEH
jgi:hypothetical protein